MRKESNQKISSLIETSMKNLTSMVDVNTIIGRAVKTEDGNSIIPISKVTVAFMTGGGETSKAKIFTKSEDLPFTGGSGAVVSMKPCGFLIENKDKNFKLLTMDKEPIEMIYDVVNDYVNKVEK